MAGNTKSRGKNPKEPITAFTSPKKGSMAAMVVAATTDRERVINLGITFRAENCGFFVLANVRSSTSLVGCKYTCLVNHGDQYLTNKQTTQEATLHETYIEDTL